MAGSPSTPPWATGDSRDTWSRRLGRARADAAQLRRARWSAAPAAPAASGPPARRTRPVPGGVADWWHTRLTRPLVSADVALEVHGAERLVPGRRPLVLVAAHQHERDAELIRAALPTALGARVRTLGPRQVRWWSRLPWRPAGSVALVFADGEPSTDGSVGEFDPAVVGLARAWGAIPVPVVVCGSFALGPGRPSLDRALRGADRRVAVRFGTPTTVDAPSDPAPSDPAPSEGTRPGDDEQQVRRLRDAVLGLLDEDARTWWHHLVTPGAVATAPAAGWRRVWAATAADHTGDATRIWTRGARR